jgi:hypothetical protein
VVTDVADGDLAATYESIARDIRKLWQPASEGDLVMAPWGSCSGNFTFAS